MSDKNKSQASENWIEEAISKEHIKYYEYKDFRNIQNIGHGQYGEVYRANWKNSEQYFALKSLFNPDNDDLKEIVREVIANHKYNVYVS